MGAMKHEDALYRDEAEQLREEVRRLRAELSAVRARAAADNQQVVRGPVVIGRGIEDEPVVLAGKRYAELVLSLFGPEAPVEVLDLNKDQRLSLRVGDLVGAAQDPA